MTVQWPHRRQDVLNALDVLAEPPPELSESGRDPRWPGLTDAVHWLVDDTGWDQADPARSVGKILRDEDEAAVLRAVVAAVLDVADRQGPGASDAHWFGDPRWPDVCRSASAAAAVLRGVAPADPTQPR